MRYCRAASKASDSPVMQNGVYIGKENYKDIFAIINVGVPINWYFLPFLSLLIINKGEFFVFLNSLTLKRIFNLYYEL